MQFEVPVGKQLHPGLTRGLHLSPRADAARAHLSLELCDLTGTEDESNNGMAAGQCGLRRYVSVIGENQRDDANAPALGVAASPGDIGAALDADFLKGPAEVAPVRPALSDANVVPGTRLTRGGAGRDFRLTRQFGHQATARSRPGGTRLP